MINDFGDMYKLRDSLSHISPKGDINVEITNGYFMNIVFINSGLQNLEPEEKVQITEKVGSITRYFFDDTRISAGQLTFINHRNFILAQFTNTTDAFTLRFPDNYQN